MSRPLYTASCRPYFCETLADGASSVRHHSDHIACLYLFVLFWFLGPFHITTQERDPQSSLGEGDNEVLTRVYVVPSFPILSQAATFSRDTVISAYITATDGSTSLGPARNAQISRGRRR